MTTPRQTKDILKICLKANVPVFIHGESGIGKSEIVDQLVKEMKNDFVDWIDLRLGSQDVGDLIGIPREFTDKDGIVWMVWSRPQWVLVNKRRPWDWKEPVVIFLDEANRAVREVIQGIFSAVTPPYHIHQHFLPEGTRIIAAGNPSDVNYDVNETVYERAFISRFLHLMVEVDECEWLDYMNKKYSKNGYNLNFVKFIESNPTFLLKQNSNWNIIDRLYCSPRLGERIVQVESSMTRKEKDIYHYTIIKGLIGETATVNYLQWLASDKNVTPKDVLDCYDKIQDKVKKLNKSQQAALVDGVYREIKHRKDVANYYDNFKKFLADLDRDQTVGIIKYVLREATVDEVNKHPIVDKMLLDRSVDELLAPTFRAMQEGVKETVNV